jgi:hypothetical protein
MSNTTAIHRHFTRIAFGLLVLSAVGCENSNILTPPPAPTGLPPLPSATRTTVRLEGRVFDEHTDQPVEGARITITWINPGPPMDLTGATPPSTTADGTGSFSLAVDLPDNWLGVTLRVERDGFDPVGGTYLQKTEAVRALSIGMYRSLTIRPGESIATAVSLRSDHCGYLMEPCRRVSVDAPTGKLVEIEVVGEDTQHNVGLAIEADLGSGFNFPRKVTVLGGDKVWIVAGQLGRVTLRATGL